MLFNSLSFLVFLVVVLILYYSNLLSWNNRKRMLLFTSYVFYGLWNPPLVIILWLSTIVDWVAANNLALEENQRKRNGWLALSMVVNLGLVCSGMWLELGDEILAVRKSVGTLTKLKVIIESAALTDEQIVMTCRVAVANGADFVKTSTGFHKSGGATVHAVELMRSTVGASVGVKASGGIRSRETAVAMINAGASRIGTSASAAILAV